MTRRIVLDVDTEMSPQELREEFKSWLDSLRFIRDYEIAEIKEWRVPYGAGRKR